MTKDEFLAETASVVRHLLTAGAGAVAANGLGTTPVVAIGTAAVFVGTLAWSFIEKSSLLSQICAAAPASELETLASDLVAFRQKGSNPLLIAHLAQTVLALANAELVSAHPELAPQPGPVPAPSSPPAQEPEPTPLVANVAAQMASVGLSEQPQGVTQ